MDTEAATTAGAVAAEGATVGVLGELTLVLLMGMVPRGGCGGDAAMVDLTVVRVRQMSESGNCFVALRCSVRQEDYPAANLVWGSIFFPCCAESDFWIILCKCGVAHLRAHNNRIISNICRRGFAS